MDPLLASIGGALAFSAVLVGVILIAVYAVVRFYRQRVLGEALVAAEGTVVLEDAMALSYGIESLGRAQVRGNVALVCTDEELLFVQWVPRKTVRIRRSDIVRIETPDSHLEKSRGVDLLKVVYRTDAGEDSVAYQVRQLRQWVAELQTGVAEAEPQPVETSQPTRRPHRQKVSE